MLISHDPGFLFIHIPKTAGSSMLKALQPFSVQRPRSTWRRRMIWLGPVNRIAGIHHAIEFPVHVTAAMVRRCLPRAQFDGLFKFAFTRNPWDAMVSQYLYIRDTKEHHLNETVREMSGFAEFLRWDLSRHNRNQHRFITDHRGRLLIDFLGRFETLSEDFAAICDKLRLQVTLPHTNQSVHRDYREYYDQKTRQLVADHFARDIAMFGYRFSPTHSRVLAPYFHPVPHHAWNQKAAAAQTRQTRTPHLTYWVQRDLPEQESIISVLADPDRCLGDKNALIKNDPATTVGTTNGWVVKRFNPRHPLDPLKDFFRLSKARRALNLSRLLAVARVPSVEVVAAADRRCCGWLSRCYQITRYLDGAVDLPQWTGDLDRPARDLGIVMARLHNAGFAHRDLKPTNILVDAQGDLHLVDLEGLQFMGRVPDHVAARNIARLLHGPGEIERMTPVHRRIFLRHYCRARGISPRYLVKTAYPSAVRRRKGQRIAGRALVAGIILLAGIGVWDAWIKDRVIPKRWGAVQEGRIYRSGQLHPALIERMLREHNISVIVDLTNDRHPEPFQIAEAETAKSLGIEHRHYPLKGDGTGNIRQYAAAIARIHQASLSNQPVLVHCAAGSQRTGGVIASYRLFVEHAPVADVLKEMEHYDWDPVKNRVLLDYLNKHMKELADLLVKEGVIDAPPDPLPVLSP